MAKKCITPDPPMHKGPLLYDIFVIIAFFYHAKPRTSASKLTFPRPPLSKSGGFSTQNTYFCISTHFYIKGLLTFFNKLLKLSNGA
ncbi:hypothetical protein ACRALDRAFT_2018142 [Sodiomyces alcalophilus JCM 7366]|uniref:uncharacterized protein n=1 Tax=Sodiomyces alcalophilus JCM 7366 TaxID=591952 RepID=UPI0039B593CB